MTLLDKLTLQVENILDKQKDLKLENERLQKQLDLLANDDETILKLKQERAEQEKELEALTERLEKLLT